MPRSQSLPKILPIDGVIKHYDWGSTHHIPELLGRVPDGQPYAELWLGAHRSGSAVTAFAGASQEIFELIAVHPEEMLGEDVHRRAVRVNMCGAHSVLMISLQLIHGAFR